MFLPATSIPGRAAPHAPTVPYIPVAYKLRPPPPHFSTPTMNPPPARKDGEFCGVIFGGGDKAILHVPLLQSIIHAVVIDGMIHALLVYFHVQELM